MLGIAQFWNLLVVQIEEKQNKTKLKKKNSIISINSFETKMFLNTTNFLKKFSWKFSLKTYHASN